MSQIENKSAFLQPEVNQVDTRYIEPSEQCEMNMKVSNKYYVPSKDASDVLKIFSFPRGEILDSDLPTAVQYLTIIG